MKVFRVLRQVIQNQAIGRPSGPWHFAGVSQFSLSKIGAFLPARAGRSLIPNPLDLNQLPPATPETSKKYVGVGRLSPEKGFTLFAQAANRAEVRGVIVGAGESEREIADANPRMEFLGWLDQEKVLRTLREARVLVFPSLCPETLGLTPLEAAAQGVPSVVSDDTAAIDRVIDGRTGLHFRTGDSEDLARCLGRLKDDRFVSDLGRNAYESYWRNPLSLAKHVDALQQLYDTLLAAAASPAP